MFRTVVLASLLLTGCAEDVGKNKAEAVVAAPSTVAAPTVAKGTSFAVDVAHSKLGALGAKITRQHQIDLHDFAGTVTVDGDAVTGVTFTAQVASLTTSDAHLQTHLKTPDFLDVDEFPTATFTSTEIKAGSDVAGMTHTVSGDLTIRGQTKRVTFPATIALTPTAVTAKTEFTIDRRDFGVVYSGKPDDLVQDHVLLQVDFTAPRS